jgi:hypothetical protein
LGKAKINILTLSIAYEGGAVPLLWTCLPKAGNASAAEHQALIERFIHLFGKEKMLGVLGDREFASGELFSWCNQEKIPFYIRVKEGSVARINARKINVIETFFRPLNPKEQSLYGMNVELFGARVYLVGSRSERGELLIVATNQKNKNAIAVYLRRWEIENLFACLKGRGFRFEDTHLTSLERIEKRMALLVVGFCWAHKIGEWKARIKPILFKKYRDSIRPQHSLFRYGFDALRDILLSTNSKICDFYAYLQALILPTTPQGRA